MAITTKNRSDLKSYFVKNAIPTEQNFADLIDAVFNQADDGVFKIGDDPVSVSAAPGDQRRVLRFYSTYPAQNPDWTISLKPRSNANDASSGRVGFGLDSPDGTNRLFLDANGRLGLGTTTPNNKLTVEGGDVAIQGGEYRRLKIISDSFWAGIELVARQDGKAGHPHIDFTHGDLDSPNFGLRLYAVDNEKMSLLAGTAANTKLGIGVTPAEALHVNGNAKISGGITGASLSVGALTATSSANLTGLSTTGLVNHAGDVKAQGYVQAQGGLTFGNSSRSGHIEHDGALYRTGGQVWLTVDDNFYIRDVNGGNDYTAHFDTNNRKIITPALHIGGLNRTEHVDNDGIFYRKGNDLWLTIDQYFYVRDKGASGDDYAFRIGHGGGIIMTGNLKADKVFSGGAEVLPLRIASGECNTSDANLRLGNNTEQLKVWTVSYSGFTSAPTVRTAFKILDVHQGRNLRADCWARNVTKDGAEIVFRTWGDTVIYRVCVSWIAHGT